MSIFNFRKNKEKSKEENAPFIIENFYEVESLDGFFKNYCMSSLASESEYAELESNSYFNITLGIIRLLNAFWMEDEIGRLVEHLTLTESNYDGYSKEQACLRRLSRVFRFFSTTRVHEIKKYYRAWMVEYYEKEKKPIFVTNSRNGYLPDNQFIMFVYQKILDIEKIGW